MRILVADDDGIMRRALTKMLQSLGYEVLLAQDGNHAWQLLQKPDAPYLVILDWMMPGMDGVAVCSKLRTLEKDISPYVILLTAMDNKTDLVKGFNAGADDYVAKPFYPDELFVRIRAGERIINLQMESLAARDALRKQATYDFLTGLRNRAAILNELQRECEKSPRLNIPVSVVMVDVDHFKQVNDTYGHPAGDKVLAEVAKRMASAVRTYEAIGRYGGEEFVIVLTGCDLDGAGIMAERVRCSVAARECDVRGTKIPVSVSLGVSSSSQIVQATPKILTEMADSALYRAKQAGRNRVELACDVFGNNLVVSADQPEAMAAEVP
jgi:two-component system, cell cycle response regulator